MDIMTTIAPDRGEGTTATVDTTAEGVAVPVVGCTPADAISPPHPPRDMVAVAAGKVVVVPLRGVALETLLQLILRAPIRAAHMSMRGIVRPMGSIPDMDGIKEVGRRLPPRRLAGNQILTCRCSWKRTVAPHIEMTRPTVPLPSNKEPCRLQGCTTPAGWEVTESDPMVVSVVVWEVVDFATLPLRSVVMLRRKASTAN